MFIHVNSDEYLERHYTEETADWCNHETRTSSVQQWIVARKERKWHEPANHVNVTGWQAKYRGILNQVRHAIKLVLPAPNQEALLPGSMGNGPIISTIRGTLNVIHHTPQLIMLPRVLVDGAYQVLRGPSHQLNPRPTLEGKDADMQVEDPEFL